MERGFKRLFYGTTLFFIALTGFAQMPIFKRYYIADMPGLGWLARFYVTHSLHYALAALFVALAFYGGLDFFLRGKTLSALTFTGKFKAAMVLGLMVSGAVMVLRNLPGVYFSHVSIYVMNLTHLGCGMALIGASVWGMILKQKRIG